MSTPLLHHQRVVAPEAAPASWLVFLHGLFGSSRNWAAVAHRLVRQRPDWGALLVDLRHHAGSHGFQPPNTIEAAAGDVLQLLGRLGLSANAVLGHSLGGKIALAFAGTGPLDLEQVWVVESTPEPGQTAVGAGGMLEILKQLPESFATRAEAVRALTAAGVRGSVANWMSANLERQGAGFGWRFRRDALEELFADFVRADLWSLVDETPSVLQFHFVRGEESEVLTHAAAARIRESAGRGGRVALHSLTGGHWLNADNPDGIVRLLSRFL